MIYDYKIGKDKIEDIILNNTEIKETDKIPKDDTDFTYDNGIKTWVGAVFVDIISSTELIENKNELEVSKILRAFSSEVISIMNNSENARQIGIRGDCVFGVFSVPKQNDVYELSRITFYINDLVKMLNKLLTKYGYSTIEVGIGMAIGKDLVIKAGKKGTGINDMIWIGDSVVKACNLGNIAGRDGNKTIAFSSLAYSNFIDEMVKNNSEKSAEEIKGWFSYNYENKCYFADIIISDFDDYINQL